MTILGVVRDGLDRLLVWSDSEGYDGVAPVGQVSKLVVNPLANALGASAGHSAVFRAVDRSVSEATEFDDLERTLAERLRVDAAIHAERLQRDRRDSFADQTYILAGWSRRARCVMAWELRGSGFFVPTLLSREASPRVPELQQASLQDRPSILRVARAQMDVVRERYATGSGGPLVIVEIMAGFMRAWRLESWLSSDTEKELINGDTADVSLCRAARENAG